MTNTSGRPSGSPTKRVASEPETGAVRSLHLAASEADRQLAARLRMRPLDLAAMIHISSASSPIGPKQLSERIGITPAATTELLDRLRNAGHVRRDHDQTDRRRVNLTASDSAVSAIVSELSTLGQRLDALARDFSDTERVAIQRYLTEAAEIFLHRPASS